jgi:signal transduction histidine kinase
VYFVSDTGIGIAKRYRDRIWDVFYRVDWDGAAPGDGVGLSIVKRIVDKHAGRTWLESEEGQGTTFFVELPAESFTAIE